LRLGRPKRYGPAGERRRGCEDLARIVSRTTTLNSSLDVEPTSVSAKSTSLGAENNCADASGASAATAAKAEAAVSQDLRIGFPPFDIWVSQRKKLR
jgi:hypothetical protein